MHVHADFVLPIGALSSEMDDLHAAIIVERPGVDNSWEMSEWLENAEVRDADLYDTQSMCCFRANAL